MQHPKTIRNKRYPELASRIVKAIRSHPANEDHPNRALLRAFQFQVRKRVGKGDMRVQAYGLTLDLPRSSGSLSNLGYFTELFEWQNIGFLRHYLKPGDRLVDVGANVGMFTYAALRATFPSGTVDAFEPLPWAASTIRRNVSLNSLADRVRLHEVAAAEGPGVSEFTADLDVSSHLVNATGGSISRQTIRVSLASLDDSLEVGELALAKFDVEGAEFRALKGFVHHLEAANPPVLLVEAHDHSLRSHGSSRSDVLELLHSFGYSTHTYDPHTRQFADPAPGWNSDVIAVHASHSEAVLERLRGGGA